MTSVQVVNLQFGSASQFRQYIFYVSNNTLTLFFNEVFNGEFDPGSG